MIGVRKIRCNINLWSIVSTILILLIILPNFDILAHLFTKSNENWNHIKTYMLKDYVINSIKMIFFTGGLTMIIGTLLAWLICAYDFPFRKFFQWALLLPLAVPPYIGAYTYNGIFNYTGIIQKFFRNVLHLQINPKYFDIMSINGAIFIFTMFLFPYVYMTTRAFLEKQSAALIENARVLGRNSFEIFIYVIIPISRGAILGGTTLVALEVLNDYGVVSYFGVSTFSTAIFSTWFAMGDIDSAVKLASSLIVVVLSILVIEKWFRGRKKYSFTTTKVRPIVRKKLKRIQSILAVVFCSIVFGIGFLIPVLQLIYWGILTYKNILNIDFVNMVYNSIWLALSASLLIVLATIIIANFCRIQENWVSKLFSKITLIGYSIPGSVIAMGAILVFVDIDRKMQWLYKIIDPNAQRLVLSSSIIMLIFAYVIRFLAVSFQSIEAGFDKVGKKFFEASRMLGNTVTKTFFTVDFPMIRPAVMSGFALAFVDIVKELPLTLILRPFNFNTLATKTFEYANNEMIQEASIPSLIIIMISIIAIYLLHKIGEKESI